MKTKTKLFCSCPADSFGLGPNVSTCPVCLGLPGSLPTINQEAIEKAIMFSQALGCSIPEITQFHRKNYYYPDAPKNYQISQYDKPVGEHGQVNIEGRNIGITRCHVEDDAGKSVHPTYANHSLIDLNRAGAPLIEMVTEPDIHSPEEARQFLFMIRAIAQTLGVSDANPEEGKMRADVNISLRQPGEPLGTKVEIKNLNSFKSVKRALEYEIKRQTRILEEGKSIVQSTLGWDEGGQKTYLMRTKEEAADYRYFPDPDLPAMHIAKPHLEALRAKTPELPQQKLQRYLSAEVRSDDAKILAFDHKLADFFDKTLSLYKGKPQIVANWLNGDIAGYVNAEALALHETKLSPENLSKLLSLIDLGDITGKTAKDLLADLMQGKDPETLVEEKGLKQITNEAALEEIVTTVISDNPDLVARVKANPKAINALLGLVMRETKGKAKPEAVRELLSQRLL